MKHPMPLLNLTRQLLSAIGVMIRQKKIVYYERVMKTFSDYLKVPGEQVRIESLKCSNSI